MNLTEMTRIYRRAVFVSSFAVVAMLSSLTTLASESPIDRALLDALASKDLGAARQALVDGANPEAVLGRTQKDNALCLAIDDRGTEFLELLLEFDASPNFKLDTGHRSLRTPLACAISYYNPDAFHLLLDIGADAEADLCIECPPGFAHSAFTDALIASHFPMALELAERTELDEIEIMKLRRILEITPYDAYHPWNPAREALIAWAQDQGIEFIPRRASEGPPGTVPKCIFTSRDIEEGRETGSVCPGDFERQRATRARR